MSVFNDAQLSKDFDGLYLAKGKLIFALSSTIIFTVLLSPFFCQFILHRKQMECKISMHHLFVCFLTAAHAFGTSQCYKMLQN